MDRKVRIFKVSTVVPAALLAGTLAIFAQWPEYSTPGPKTKDGKIDLAGAAPRTAEGKPDFSGLWEPAARSRRTWRRLVQRHRSVAVRDPHFPGRSPCRPVLQHRRGPEGRPSVYALGQTTAGSKSGRQQQGQPRRKMSAAGLDAASHAPTASKDHSDAARGGGYVRGEREHAANSHRRAK